MTLITFADVQSGHLSTIPDFYRDAVDELIREAEFELENTLKQPVGDWIDAKPEWREPRVEIVLARMIRRVLKNPDSLITETEGDYSYGRLIREGMDGTLTVTSADRRMLGLPTRRIPRAHRIGLPRWSPRNQTHGY